MNSASGFLFRVATLAGLALLLASSAAAQVDGLWRVVGPPLLTSTSTYTATLDPDGDRVLVYGTANGFLWSYALDGSRTWRLVHDGTNGPIPRYNHTAIHDPVGRALVVFGGQNSSGVLLSDVWSYSLANDSWTQLLPSGSGPGAVLGPMAIYDSDGLRMIVVKGNQAWSLSLSGDPVWTPLLPGGVGPPANLRYASLIHDPIRQRAVLFGGWDETSDRSDTYALSLTGTPTWSRILPFGALPDPNSHHSAVYDPVGDRMIEMSGAGSGNPWALNLSGTPMWTRIVPANTASIAGPIVLDGRRNRIAVPYPSSSLTYLDLASPQWTVEPLKAPAARSYHSAVLDSTRRRMIAYGGAGNTSLLADVWSLDLVNDAWSPVPGAELTARRSHSAIVDPVRDEMIVFGGTFDNSNGIDQTWKLSLSTMTWSQVVTGGPLPPPRYEHSAVYDAAGDRMIVFGGRQDLATRLADVWALSLASGTWSEIQPGPGPAPRAAHAAIVDPAGRRMIIAAGNTFNNSTLNDVWALDLGPSSAWTPSSAALSARFHVGAYDPHRHRMVLLGEDLVQELPLAEDGPSRILWPDGEHRHFWNKHSAIYDPARDRLVAFGGISGGNDLEYVISPPGVVTVPAAPAATRLAIAWVVPNPARGPMRVDFTLPDRGSVRLEVFDLHGRRTLVKELGALPPGRHVVTLTNGGMLTAGVHFIRLIQGDRFVTSRVVMLE